MKIYLSLIWLIVGWGGLQAQDSLRLPMKLQIGIGPFYISGSVTRWKPLVIEDCKGWCKCRSLPRGIPDTWKEVEQIEYPWDMRQWTYQCYLRGDMDLEMYEGVQQSWKWVPDTNRLAGRAIAASIHFIRGLNERNERVYRIDRDNDLDFSNEEDRFFPPPYHHETPPNPKRFHAFYDSLVSHAIYARAEAFNGWTVIDTLLPIFLWREEDDTEVAICVPVYATSRLDLPGKSYDIAVGWGFSRPFYIETAELVPFVHDSLYTHKVADEQIYKQGDSFSLAGQTFEFLGVSEKWEVLLREVGEGQADAAPQVGFRAPDFKAVDLSGKPVELSQLRGKYVYLDFWDLGCKPCIDDLPELSRLYQNADTTQIAFIGLLRNGGDFLHKLSTKHNIVWQQLVGETATGIFETYRVKGYPTTFLISPEGIIISRDARWKRLEMYMEEYGLKKE